MRSVRQKITTFISILVLATVHDLASAAEAADGVKRPRVGLVLSGGGALGLAHIGVLQVLEELYVPVDCVVGTSMGALVGGAYAAGISTEKMHENIVSTDLAALFDDNPPRSEQSQYFKSDDYEIIFDFTLGFNNGDIQLPTGASAGYKFELFLKELMGQSAALSNLSFDDLPSPYRAIGTDLETGGMTVFESGELSRVMRASMSLPAIIAPVEIAGRIYIDGGLSRNLPVNVGRELCGDVLIAVNLGTKPKTRDDINNSLQVAYQSVVILTEQNVNESIAKLTSNDILIEPNLEGFDSASFDSKSEIIMRGIEAGRANQAALTKLSVSPEAYRAWQDMRQQKIPSTVTPTSVSIETDGYINVDAVMRDIKTEMGERYDSKQLHNDIIDIFGRGDFSYIGYSIDSDEQGATAVIEANTKPWGPGFLKLGLGAATDFNGPTQMNIAASYRRTWINTLGAEWRTDIQLGYDSLLRTEFLQPLQVRDGAFVSPYIEGSRSFLQLYDKTLRLGDVQIKRAQAGFELGVTGRLGEIKFAPYINQINSIPDFGAITGELPQEKKRQVGVELAAVYDQLDSFSFPRSGLFASVDVKDANKQLGGEDDYTRAQIKFTGATSIGKQTMTVDLEWGDEISDAEEVPIYANFQLGGPKRLSGLYLDQLRGTHYSLATLSFYHQYATLPSQLGRGLYIGLSMEAGKINDQFMEDPSDWMSAGSIYWGAETILGAAYIGYGYTSQNQSVWYLTIGPRF